MAVYRRRKAGDGRAGRAPRSAGDAELLRRIWRNHHPLRAVDAGGVRRLADAGKRPLLRTLKQVFCSGEALPTALCREWEQLTHAPLHNLYGPTEAAVDVSWYPAYGPELAAVEGNSVPIGFPVWNTGLRILDAMMRPVPFGVAGICISPASSWRRGIWDAPTLPPAALSPTRSRRASGCTAPVTLPAGWITARWNIWAAATTS